MVRRFHVQCVCDDFKHAVDITQHLVVPESQHTVAAGDQPLLPLPATAELVGKLPQEILTAIMNEVNGTNPRVSPAGSTGNPS